MGEITIEKVFYDEDCEMTTYGQISVQSSTDLANIATAWKINPQVVSDIEAYCFPSSGSVPCAERQFGVQGDRTVFIVRCHL